MRTASRLGIVALMSGLFILFGFGCKGLSQEEQAVIKPVTLTYWTVFGDTEALKKLAAEYQKQRPYVKINIRQVRYEEFDKLLLNALADDVAPDIVSVHTRWLRRYQNRLEPMPAAVKVGRLVQKNNITKDTVVVVDTNALPNAASIKRDYVAAVPNDVIIGKEVYGLPLSFDTLAVYYNKDLLDKAGIPEPPTTWEEFLQAIKQTTKYDQNGRVVQAGVALGTASNIDNAFDIISALMLQNGVTIASRGSVQFASGLDKAGPSHPTLQALNFYTDFARPTKESYTWNDTMPNAFDAFVRGRLAFYFGFAYDLPRLESRAPDLNIEVVPLPQLDPSAPVNVANYWVESVLKKSKNKNEAWDFVRFLTSPDTVKKYTKATLRPSPFRAHLKEYEADPKLAPFASQALIAENWYRGYDIDVAEKAFDSLIAGLLVPYAETDDPLKRDANLIIRAAQEVQQTL